MSSENVAKFRGRLLSGMGHVHCHTLCKVRRTFLQQKQQRLCLILDMQCGLGFYRVNNPKFCPLSIFVCTHEHFFLEECWDGKEKKKTFIG